jgi:hypothetical protein
MKFAMKAGALLMALAVSMTGIVAMQSTAHADWDWCFDDPLTLVQGRVLDVQVGVPLTSIKNINGPVQVTVYVPSNVSANVVLSAGLLYPITTQVVRTQEVWKAGTSVNVRVDVLAKSKAGTSFPVTMLVTHQSAGLKVVDIKTVQGTSNQVVSGKFALSPILGLIP